MKVHELITVLQRVQNQNALVSVRFSGGGGCSTCGYNSEEITEDFDVYDLATRTEVCLNTAGTSMPNATKV